jgi:hypothetical protein
MSLSLLVLGEEKLYDVVEKKRGLPDLDGGLSNSGVLSFPS